MLICFFDVNGIVHKEFVLPGQTVNQHFYLDVLRRLRESVRRKRSEMWRNGNWLLHHDNAPAHTALTVRQFLTSNNMVIVPHPPYSPDLAPSDFFLFPRMKRSLKGKRFRDVDEVKENTLKALNSIQAQEFQHCFEQWQKHWDKFPVVSVLSTGNEIQEPDRPLEAGRIRDSNKTTLLSLIKEHGFSALDLGIARDEKPTTFATCIFEGKKKLMLGLPGNPVSAAVTSHLYLLPAMRKMSGYTLPLGTTIKATTAEDIVLDPRPEYHRAVLTWLPHTPVPRAVSTGNQISSRLLSFSSANCLLNLPGKTEQLEVLPAGTQVDALIIARL
ncbi:hypothetical protein B7P43_G06514 [Cryptotermes secundus]|uniref:MoeA C-terminal domain-containing protein n=1 Tax=Cryptotermes secundus TaxID=105785 RepID=A0A2J7Q4H8_9NEOP|nr:hypothetical protein B7P43_G06514 [Cryptotermes secundus]